MEKLTWLFMSFKGIGLGLKAVAKSWVTPSSGRYRIKGHNVICPICRHDEFDQKDILMNTTSMTFFNLDWLNSSGCALICKHCSRIEFFADAPDDR